MEYTIKNTVLKEHKGTLLVGVFNKYNDISYLSELVNEASLNQISNLMRQGEILTQRGDITLVHNVQKSHILLVGLGKGKLSIYQYKIIVKKIFQSLARTAVEQLSFPLQEIEVKECNNYWKIRHFIESIEESMYKFDTFKTSKKADHVALKKISFHFSGISMEYPEGKLAIQHALAISNGVNLAKDLGNLPPNICNASYLFTQSIQIAKKYNNISVYSVNEKDMQDLGMRAYLAVGRGAKNKPLMSVINYRGNQSSKETIVLVGKGLTFDSGGISIKPSENMHYMKYDMCGSAAVYGVMDAIANLNLSINVIGILAGCENMVSSSAYRPGDILKTMSGKTVEVINTDAEGRLVLCDVLTYIERFKPKTVIDVATLTGASVIALGKRVTAFMTNNDILAKEIDYASNQSHDSSWRLPLKEELQEQLDSNCADLANTGGYYGGAITAGYFLSQFTKRYNWAHLDIAGTAWSEEKKYGATGRPVALLCQLLINLSKIKK